MKNNSKGFAYLVLIIGVVLIGIVGIILYPKLPSNVSGCMDFPFSTYTKSATYCETFYGKEFRQPNYIVDESEKPDQIPNINTSSWKTYEIIKGQATIKLPQYLNDFTCDMSACWLASTRFNSGTTISIASSPSTLTNVTWDEVISELQKNEINYTTKTLSGKEAILLKTNKMSLPFPTPLDSESLTKEGVVIKIDEGYWTSLFIYKFDSKLKGESPSEDELKTFNQILSTFKVTEDRKVVEQKLPSGVKTSCNTDSDCQGVISSNNCEYYCVSSNPSNQTIIDSIIQTCDPTLWDPPLSLECGCINNNCELYNEQ